MSKNLSRMPIACWLRMNTGEICPLFFDQCSVDNEVRWTTNSAPTQTCSRYHHLTSPSDGRECIPHSQYLLLMKILIQGKANWEMEIDRRKTAWCIILSRCVVIDITVVTLNNVILIFSKGVWDIPSLRNLPQEGNSHLSTPTFRKFWIHSCLKEEVWMNLLCFCWSYIQTCRKYQYVLQTLARNATTLLSFFCQSDEYIVQK